MVALTATSVPHDANQRAPKLERLGQNAARHLVKSQGNLALAVTHNQAIGEHVTVGETLDGQGDAVRARIWELVRFMTARAKLTRDYESHDAGVEALALAERYEELDQHEDDHRRATGRHTSGQRANLRAALAVHGELLRAGYGPEQ